MRIISSFQDFYDSAAGYDDEPTPVYVRERATTALKGHLPFWGYRASSEWTVVEGADRGAELVARALVHPLAMAFEAHHVEDAEAILVGFCGMVGPVWRWRGRCFWDPMDLTRAAGADESHVIGGVRAEWPPSAAERADTLPLFRALDVPAFALHAAHPGIRLERDPPLGPFELQRIVDPYTARQAVETYLGNELAKQVDPTDSISDEVMRDKKGFDDASFKAPPGGPTRKRTRRKG